MWIGFETRKSQCWNCLFSQFSWCSYIRKLSGPEFHIQRWIELTHYSGWFTLNWLNSTRITLNKHILELTAVKVRFSMHFPTARKLCVKIACTILKISDKDNVDDNDDENSSTTIITLPPAPYVRFYLRVNCARI